MSKPINPKINTTEESSLDSDSEESNQAKKSVVPPNKLSARKPLDPIPLDITRPSGSRNPTVS